MKKRTYSPYSYADRYLWSAVIDNDTAKRIRRSAGDNYVEEEIQIANLLNHLRNLGKGNLATDFVASLEESDVIEWKP